MSLQDLSCPHISSSCILRATSIVQHLRKMNVILSFASIQCATDELFVCVHCADIAQFSGRSVGDGGIDSVQHHVTEHRHCLYVRGNEPYEMFCVKCGEHCYSRFYDFLIDRKRPTDRCVQLPKLSQNFKLISCGMG